MRGWLQLTWIEMKLFLREPIVAFFSLIFPLMLLLLFGSIYGNDPTPFLGGRGSVDLSVPAYIAMVIATNGLMSLPITITLYRERGILLRFQATPLRPQAVLAAEVMVNAAMTLVGSLVLIVVGVFVYHLHFQGNPLSVLGAFLLSTLSFFALGFVLASILPNARTTQAVAMVIFFPMLFLSGSSLPLELLPATLQKVAQFLPLTHVVKLMQGAWFGEGWSAHTTNILVLALILVVGVVISVRLFRWRT